MAYIAGGVGVALRGEGIAPGELNGVDGCPGFQRFQKVAGRQAPAGSFPKDEELRKLLGV